MVFELQDGLGLCVGPARTAVLVSLYRHMMRASLGICAPTAYVLHVLYVQQCEAGRRRTNERTIRQGKAVKRYETDRGLALALAWAASLVVAPRRRDEPVLQVPLEPKRPGPYMAWVPGAIPRSFLPPYIHGRYLTLVTHTLPSRLPRTHREKPLYTYLARA